MIILPDVRGLHQFYEELALRFAEAGVDALAIDYFGRTAGIGDARRGFDHKPHVSPGDLERAARRHAGGGRGVARRAAAFGRCSTSASASAAGCRSRSARSHELELAGAIGFYGWPAGEHRSGSPRRSTAWPQIQLRGAGASSAAPIRASARTWSRPSSGAPGAGVDHEVITYPNAPHSFFDRKQAEFADGVDGRLG